MSPSISVPLGALLLLVLGGFSVKIACSFFPRRLVREPGLLSAVFLFATVEFTLVTFPALIVLPFSVIFFSFGFSWFGVLATLFVGCVVGAWVGGGIVQDWVVQRKDLPGWYWSLAVLVAYHLFLLFLASPLVLVLVLKR